MKQDIDREKYVTISQMAKLFDGDPSHYAIRRHIENYGQYFDTVFYRGVRYIEKQSGVKVIGVIHNAIRPGRNRGGLDVLDALKAAGIEPVQTQADSDPPNPIPLLEKEVVVRFSNEDRELIKRLIEKVG